MHLELLELGICYRLTLGYISENFKIYKIFTHLELILIE